jgi:hypothetical protein
VESLWRVESSSLNLQVRTGEVLLRNVIFYTVRARSSTRDAVSIDVASIDAVYIDVALLYMRGMRGRTVSS